MQRKWTIALVSMFSFSILVAGISMADDTESPLHVLMEKVNLKTNAIKKAVRTPVAYKKGQKDVVSSTEELIKLAKDAKDLSKDAVKKAKGIADPDKKWAERCDAFSKELQTFHDVASKPATTQDQAKKAFSKVSTSCTDCHMVFRVEEENF
jgi:cytochrome c556